IERQRPGQSVAIPGRLRGGIYPAPDLSRLSSGMAGSRAVAEILGDSPRREGLIAMIDALPVRRLAIEVLLAHGGVRGSGAEQAHDAPRGSQTDRPLQPEDVLCQH